MLEQPAMNKFLRDSTYNQLLLANVPALWLRMVYTCGGHLTNVYSTHLHAGRTGHIRWANVRQMSEGPA